MYDFSRFYRFFTSIVKKKTFSPLHIDSRIWEHSNLYNLVWFLMVLSLHQEHAGFMLSWGSNPRSPPNAKQAPYRLAAP